ncbi:retention module-containing protein [Grimontia sp. NTOU-MAR1]|uniref:retention module-containing protein n=1 Tax=Grimontia sp. NTOU-MAR1 TaxID=3111011 RepID=UPI002DBC0E00|nr:retention module-containing protein [Grimontia sp. NTOU-MAR1]WRV99334.1 retention module-containing protein [Grimontia sp. NTOU-MAR1]
MDSIITKQAAKVISVNGNAFIKVNGKDVPIAEVLDLNAGTEIFIPEGANALLSLEDGTMLPVGKQDSPAQDILGSPLDDEIAAIQALIEGGVDPTEVLEATAAGGTPSSSGSQAPVAIARIGEETIAQAGFDTAEIARGPNTFTPSQAEVTQVNRDIQPEIVVLAPTSPVSEGQPAVFTIFLAFEGQAVSLTSSLTLNLQAMTGGRFSAESEDLGELEYFDGTSWQPIVGGQITLPAGQGSIQVRVNTVNEDGTPVYEGLENFGLIVSEVVIGTSPVLTSNGETGVIGEASVVDDGSGSVTEGVVSDDDRPTLTVSDAGEISEGNDAVFVVTLSNPVDGNLSYKFSLQDTDIERDDITGVTINDGEPLTSEQIDLLFSGDLELNIDGFDTPFNVVLNTNPDSVFEGDESFELNVESVVGGQVISDNGSATISDDGVIGGEPGGDSDTPTLTVSGGGEVNEGKNIVFDVKLTKAVDGDVTYAFSLGNAQIDADDIEGITVNGTQVDIGAFLAGNITAAIDGSQQSFKVVIDTKGDKVFEGDESFTLNVSADTGITVDGQSGNLILNGDANATVSDDGTTHGKPGNDDRPELTVTGGGEINEGKNIVFDVKLTKAVDGDVTYAFSLGNAQIDADDIEGITVNGTQVDISAFLAGNITAAIDGSQQSFKVVIDTKGDKVFEGDESFTLNVSADTGITVDGQSGNLILNGDANATVSDDGTTHGKPGNDDRPELTVTGGGEINEGKNIVFDVKLTKAVDGDVTYAFSLGNAQIDADDIEGITVNGTSVDIGAFLAGNITAAIDGSQQSFKVVIDTKGDKVFEGDESFTLNVSADTGITVDGDNSSLVLTGNQDATISDDGNDGTPGNGDDDDDRPELTVTGGGEVSEGQDITFNVDLSNKVAGKVTYTFGIDQDGVERGDITGMTINGKALTTDDIDDVFAGTYTLDISGGNTNFDVVFNTRDDQRFEGDESFTLNVSADTGITVDGDNSSLVLTGNQDATISDDGVIDGKPGGDDDRLTISIEGNKEVSEGKIACYKITLDGQSDKEVTFKLALTEGTADSDDYGNVTVYFLNTYNKFEAITPDADGYYTVPAGVNQLLAYVDTKQDHVFEGDESFTLTVIPGENVKGITDNKSATAETIISDDGQINDKPGGDDDRPTLTVADASEVAEGTNATFDVALGNEVKGDVTYTFTLSGNGDNAADISRDIVGLTLTNQNGDAIDSVTVTMNPDGTYSATIDGSVTDFKVVVETHQDSAYEGNEGFKLDVSTNTPLATTGNDTSGVATIIDNDNPPVAIDDYKESNTLFQESFEFGNGSKGWVVVDEFNGWNITNGLEIQTGNVGGSTASDGSSHAELDSHGALTSVEISRVLDSGDGVIAGQPYTLTFDFKPRPRHEDDSDMIFTFGDYSYKVIVSASKNISFEALQEGAPVITSSSAGNGWTTISVTYTAQDDAEIKLAFANDDETTNNDTFGAYIDNIEVNGPQPYWVNNSDAEGIFIAFTYIAHNDTDADEGDTVSVWNKDDLDSFVLVPSEAGSIELRDDGQGLVFKPNPDYNGPVQIEYFATDGTNKSLESADIHIYVNEVNANDDGTGLVFETSSDDGWQNLDGNGILTISAVKIGENGQRVPQGDLVTENSEHVHDKHGIGVADEAREGNAGGVSYQVEYDHGTNASEALELILTSAADKLEIGIARLFQNEHGHGNHEVAKWTTYGEDGQVIATGEFNFGDRTSGKGVITIEAEGIYKVILEALPRVNEADSGKTSGDSSDFTITSVAVYSEQAKYTVTETETLDSTSTVQSSLLDNDGDPEGHSFKVTEINGEPLGEFDEEGYAKVEFDEGTLYINEEGEFRFVANDQADLLEGQSEQFQFEYTITDSIGDVDTAKVIIQIDGLDEAPELQLSTDSVVVDESLLDPAGSATATGYFDATDTGTASADLIAALSTSASLTTANGESINWEWDPSSLTYTGYTGPVITPDSTVMTITLVKPTSDSNTWSYVVNQEQAVRHESANDDQQDIIFDLSISDEKHTVSQPITVSIVDDGPAISAREPVTTDGNGSDNSDFPLVDVAITTKLPSQSGLLDVDYGADNGAELNPLMLALTGITSGLTSNGQPISVAISQGDIVGTANDEHVFSITLDTSTTPPSWVLTQHKAIDGDDGAFSFNVVATDRDGDTASVTLTATLTGSSVLPPDASGLGADDTISIATTITGDGNSVVYLQAGAFPTGSGESYTEEALKGAGWTDSRHDWDISQPEVYVDYDEATGAYIHGGGGNDNIIGGAGDDIIRGGTNGHGSSGATANGREGDALEGGAGSDTFLWLKEDLVNEGTVGNYDHITDFIGDFNADEDRLDLSDLVSVTNGQLDNLTVSYDEHGQLKLSIAVENVQGDTDGCVTQHIVLEKTSQSQVDNVGLDPSEPSGVEINTIINGESATLTITDSDGFAGTDVPRITIDFDHS